MPNQTAPLDVARVRSALASTRFVDVRYVAETASTNADAFALLADETSRGATLVAEFQSDGVGRKGRPWIAPAGSSLLFTAMLPAGVPAASLWAVPFWIALGVAHGVERASGERLDLVWPNDLFSSGKKAGGILSVARIAGDTAWVGCGVGLNVNRPAAGAALDALVPPPAFLSDGKPDVEREAVLVEILRAFETGLDALAQPREVAAAWERRARLAGTVYRYRRDADGLEREGTALRIGPHGTLVLRDETGEVAIDLADVRVVARQA